MSNAKYHAETPLIVVNSNKKSNHPALKQMAESSKGVYINLTVKSAQEAFDHLKHQQYKFLGYKSYVKNIDIYPRASVNIDNTFSITGKNLNNYEDVVLYFGYDSEITESITLNLKEAQKAATNVPRMWAQKRLAFLQQNSKANKKEIIQLATKYSLVTDYTSLIVLENVSDYVRYKIEPPAELLEEYNRLLAEMERDKGKKEIFIDVRQEQTDEEEMVITEQVMETSNIRSVRGNELSNTPMQIRDDISNESEIMPVEDVEVVEEIEIEEAEDAEEEADEEDAEEDAEEEE